MPQITHVNNILHSISSNAELYINNHQIYNSNGLYAQKPHISNNFKSTVTDYKRVLLFEGYDYKEDPENLLGCPFSTKRMKLNSRNDGFMLYGKLGINFLTALELLYPNLKVRIRLTRARPNFYMISENPNVSLSSVDCSLYTWRVMLKEDYHKKKMSQPAFAPVEYNCMEALAKTYLIPARQNPFNKEKILNNAPIHQIAIAINSNSFSLVRLQRSHFGINSLFREKLDYSEEDSQLYNRIRQIIVACMSQQWKQRTFKKIFHQFQLII